jgi:ubiquitin carboxyl-terminal hydrolase 5/13
MATFPSVLVLHARKFQLVNWVPTKLGEKVP